ncbi:MAG: hypothetical protein IKO25_02385 [Clostridia bacterium]|nr:hypothetical protein [Clostridia bacterium]
MAEQEFLASFGVEIDETGVEKLQAALERNRALAEDLASAFTRARESAQAFFAELAEIPVPVPAGTPFSRTAEQPETARLPFSVDFTKANADLKAFRKEAEKNLRLTADASGIVSAGRNALSSLQSLFASSVLPLRARVELSGGAPGSFSGLSGTSGTSGTSGSTGSSSGPAGSAGKGGASSASAAFAASGFLAGLQQLLTPTLPFAPVNQTTSTNVQAPVSIQVQAAGTDPEAVGQAVYDAAEQYLLRTLNDAVK